MDLFPTLAAIAGGDVPSDRVIDGIDMPEFLLGSTQESGREGFIVYMGNDVSGVKWRDWKLPFKEQTGWNGVLREYTMPRVHNLMNDPQERDNVLFPHSRVPKAALSKLEEHVASLGKYPPIKAGQEDPYEPPKYP
jgi:arylsulfatase